MSSLLLQGGHVFTQHRYLDTSAGIHRIPYALVMLSSRVRWLLPSFTKSPSYSVFKVQNSSFLQGFYGLLTYVRGLEGILMLS